jgi:hypothetical protein
MCGFRRICTKCGKLIDWTNEEDGFFHLGDYSPLCEGGHADLEFAREDGTDD